MSKERTPAWQALYAVVHRDHSEYCPDLRCDCDATSAIRTTELYQAVAEEVMGP